MFRLLTALILLIGSLWLPARAADTGWLSETSHPHVKVRLERDGERALLRVQLAEGWKTYWKSPGEGGIAPAIAWQGDPRVQWHWPTPTRFEVAGLPAQGYPGGCDLPPHGDQSGRTRRHPAPAQLQQRLRADRFSLHPGRGRPHRRRLRSPLCPSPEPGAAPPAQDGPGAKRIPPRRVAD
ncbi:suppressor for copper-sensitivity B, membrane protein [Aeromonas diversa CDC 2478-85]|uniref:Suppressor for copper-sensitivity B, membrane protein n=1 Tax=Aeromonas diversa CDC 2478-85 TaxID=1268237 RepID=N9VET9_9GAMM|nr:suppressor for copper-sensitivity B, membrane protein [Aeromonas diversa CDC 2478-85]